jgi:hypothetical protein
MDAQSHATIKLAPEPTSPQQPRARRILRFLMPLLALLLGLVLGVTGVMIYLLAISGDNSLLATPRPPQTNDISAQVGPLYITRLVEKNLKAAGMNGVSNVNVTLATGDQLTIEGDDRLFLGVTRHFTIVVQPVVQDCLLKMHILHADLSGIPITGFVSNFEDQFNQQLQSDSSSLPKGFVYCKTSVRTDPQGVYITISATPV